MNGLPYSKPGRQGSCHILKLGKVVGLYGAGPPMCGKSCSSRCPYSLRIQSLGYSRAQVPWWQGRGKEKKEEGEKSGHDWLQPLLPLLCTNLRPRKAMVWNGHRTPKTCRFLPLNITCGRTTAGRGSCPQLPSSHLMNGPERLTQAEGTVAFRGHLRPFLPSNIFSLNLKKHLPLIFSQILNLLQKFHPKLSSKPCRSLNFFCFFPNLNQFFET